MKEQTKYRLVWAISMIGVISSIVYTIITDEYEIWLLSMIYARVLYFFNNNIAFHRYFSHNSFKTGPLRHKLLTWLSILAGMGGPINYARSHRHHHKYSDTDLDLHSPHKDFWGTLFGTWTIRNSKWMSETKCVKIIAKDLLRDPTVRYVSEQYYKFWSLLVLVSLTFGGWHFTLFYIIAPAGWQLLFPSITNVVVHLNLPGSYKNFDTKDLSYNNLWLNIVLFGEGLHNNHHALPNEYYIKTKPLEFDPTGWVIRHFFDINYKK